MKRVKWILVDGQQKLQNYKLISNVYGEIEPPKQKLQNYKPFWRVYSEFESVVSPSSDQKLQNYKLFWNVSSEF